MKCILEKYLNKEVGINIENAFRFDSAQVITVEDNYFSVGSPGMDELNRLVNQISLRVAAYLERQGFLERDEESSYLQLEGMEEDPMQQLLGHSITYRVAVGPQLR